MHLFHSCCSPVYCPSSFWSLPKKIPNAMHLFHSCCSPSAAHAAAPHDHHSSPRCVLLVQLLRVAARPTPTSLCLRFKLFFTGTVEAAAASNVVEAAVARGGGIRALFWLAPMRSPSFSSSLSSHVSARAPTHTDTRRRESTRYLWERMRALLTVQQ
jgi:hypothetical protein